MRVPGRHAGALLFGHVSGMGLHYLPLIDVCRLTDSPRTCRILSYVSLLDIFYYGGIVVLVARNISARYGTSGRE